MRVPIAVICKTYSVFCLCLNSREYITTARGSLGARPNLGAIGPMCLWPVLSIIFRLLTSIIIITYHIFSCFCLHCQNGLGIRVLNAIFNNISVISWWSVLLVQETGVPGENHQPFASYWQTLSHKVVSGTAPHERDSNSQH